LALLFGSIAVQPACAESPNESDAVTAALHCAAVTVSVDGLQRDSHDSSYTPVSAFYLTAMIQSGPEAVKMMTDQMERLMQVNPVGPMSEEKIDALLDDYDKCAVFFTKAIEQTPELESAMEQAAIEFNASAISPAATPQAQAEQQSLAESPMGPPSPPSQPSIEDAALLSWDVRGVGGKDCKEVLRLFEAGQFYSTGHGQISIRDMTTMWMLGYLSAINVMVEWTGKYPAVDLGTDESDYLLDRSMSHCKEMPNEMYLLAVHALWYELRSQQNAD